MDPTHLHLAINHLPVFGFFLGAIVLLYGIWRRSDDTQIAAYILFILSSIGGIIAYLTGEGAEESLEGIQGIPESLIEQHEEAALWALIAAIAIGTLSILSLFLRWSKPAISRGIAIGMLFLALLSFGIVARTAYLGGQIRHSEIRGQTFQEKRIDQEKVKEGHEDQE